MTDIIKVIICPKCGEQNNYLLTHCKGCNLRIAELHKMQNRIFQLENLAKNSISDNAFIDAFRAYSILLEYKPKSINYLKGLCWSCIGLEQFDKLKEYSHTLQKRKPNDPDLIKIESYIHSTK
ncbi:MAG: hypothetical protein DWQ10_03620 [Calditrichaeota bacterium]|nr:MAG: hypothetical protein DWQ10_03620 [Calditrichota bacterium]